MNLNHVKTKAKGLGKEVLLNVSASLILCGISDLIIYTANKIVNRPQKPEVVKLKKLSDIKKYMDITEEHK